MHLCPGNCVAIGRAVVYFAWAAHTFSAGIKCRHCTAQKEQLPSGNVLNCLSFYTWY